MVIGRVSLLPSSPCVYYFRVDSGGKDYFSFGFGEVLRFSIDKRK
jgi:hypothetical protein